MLDFEVDLYMNNELVIQIAYICNLISDVVF